MEHKEHHHNNKVHIYTDGSKSNEGVGCAAVSEHTMKQAHLPNEASIFTAELTAVSLALYIVSIATTTICHLHRLTKYINSNSEHKK